MQDCLLGHGIKPSVQRLAVMEYLKTHCTHPTADEIFSALSPKMPTLSRTTVYNTLRLLASRGAVLSLDIDGKIPVSTEIPGPMPIGFAGVAAPCATCRCRSTPGV